MTEINPSVRADSTQEASKRLTGTLSTTDIVFTVLAFNAPLSVFVGFIPVIIGAGNGLGAPTAYTAAGALILLFTVGFTAMGRKLPNPGAFYAYITAGLGRPLGLGAAFLAVISYFFILVGGYAFGGIALEALIRDVLHGPDIAWWIWVLVLMAVVGTLGYFRISLSAKILTFFMTTELIIIVCYNVIVFATGGAHGIPTEPFMASNIFSGNVGLAVLFGIVCFSGFEATAVFREEARNPERTIPRATYIAVIMMGGLYALSAWAQIAGIGVAQVVHQTATDPTGAVLASVTAFMTKTVTDIVTVLLVTSIFAANLSTHNVTGRYIYSLSVDRIFPAALSAVHHRHGSPHRASLVTTGISVLFLMGLVLAKVDGLTIYAVLVGIGGYALIVLMLMTSLAVVGYFRASTEARTSLWKHTVAPIAAAVGLIVALILATLNVAVLVGGDQVLAASLIALFYGSVVFGVVYALVLRRRNVAVYRRIGRQEV
ncbi:APC family permease [Cryobacterium sp. TMT2-23]|uniref:APC family permease n=1 Tax=Cryobacterium sp. TMT2-23 TaxID=1259252 RepID=UPI00106BEA7F|nr:APC family permease [Cryobacterium sp. TMT2-23]TFD29117.1 APC family permease [Cryobacterium sp. TMT2-23]